MSLGFKPRAEKNNMALFTRKSAPSSAKASEGKEEKKLSQASAPALRSLGGARDLSHVLRHARITEKATMHQGMGVYTFDIAENVSKRDVMQAVRALYKVTPRKVAIVQVPAKVRRSARTGKTGTKRGGKKAYVYLKKDETITLG